MKPRLHKITDTITAIDLQFQGRENVIAAYLFYDGREAGLVETGPASTVDNLIEGVRAAGVPLESIRTLVVTHIHLDHAGAAGILAQRLHDARVYVHPVGAPHLADPSRLLDSAARLYGAQLEPLWGRTEPVPGEQISIVNDSDELDLPGATLRAFDTPGHARHHHAYLDQVGGLLFTGDIAGVRIGGARYVRPPTPPPELDVDAWRASIAKLRALKVTGLCPTHFGAHRGDVAWHWDDLEERLVNWGELVRGALERGRSEEAILEEMKTHIAREMDTLGVDVSTYDVAVSYEHVVAGYVRYWQKKMGR